MYCTNVEEACYILSLTTKLKENNIKNWWSSFEKLWPQKCTGTLSWKRYRCCIIAQRIKWQGLKSTSRWNKSELCHQGRHSHIHSYVDASYVIASCGSTLQFSIIWPVVGSLLSTHAQNSWLPKHFCRPWSLHVEGCYIHFHNIILH